MKSPHFRLVQLVLLLGLSGSLSAQNGLRDLPNPAVEAQLEAFKLLPGAEIQLFASDPMIAKPVQMNWDAAGRLWLVSSGLYPHIEPFQEEQDRVLVLEDRNRDGVADRVTTFAEGLHIPTAVIPGDGGAYVANSTELLFLADKDGDLRADERRILLSGFGTEDTHHLIHTFRHGPDSMLYFNQSIYIHSHIETPHGIRRLLGGGIWHYRPETQQLEVLAKGLINPWGLVFDDWGQSFATDGAGSEGLNFIFPRAVFRTSPGATRIVSGMTPGHPKICGLEIGSGSHLPEQLRGAFFTPDFRGHRVNVFTVEPDGSSYRAIQQPDLVASTHRAFRPVDIRLGPDGALYIADWYNPIIQHGEVDFRDPRRDRTRGRIWRISFPERPLEKRIDFAKASVPELLELLKSPVRRHREFARRTLRDRGAGQVLPPLERWAPSLQKDEHLREALWTYQSLNVFSQPLFDRLFASPDPKARAAALRVLYHRHQEHPNVHQVLTKAVKDSHPQVRLWAVSCLAQRPSAESFSLALQVLDQSMDESLDFALWSLVREQEQVWVAALRDGQLNLDARLSHLLFAVQSLEKRIAFPQIFSALEQGKLKPEAQNKAISLITTAGTPADLARLLEQGTSPDGKLKHQRLAILNSLVTAFDQRKLKPAGDLARVRQLLNQGGAESFVVAARLTGRWKVQEARAELEQVLLAPKRPRSQYQSAAEALRLLGGAPSVQFLTRVMNQSTTPAASGAAIAELARLAPRQAAEGALQLLQKSKSGQDQFGIYEVFARNPQAAAALTAVLEEAEIPQAIAITGIQRVGTAGKPLPKLLAALRKAGGVKAMTQQLSPEAKTALIAKVNQEGDPANGERIYRRDALQCVRCHAIGNVGGVIGPDLVSIGASAPVDYLIDSLIAPNVKIKEGYHTTLVSKKSGESFAGGVVSETDRSLVMRDALGNLHEIPKAEIASKLISPVSLMPPGLTAGLREDEFVDLVRFLAELGKEGAYKLKPTGHIRQWQALLPHERVRDDIGHYGTGIFAEEFKGYKWTSFGSMVDGQLPPEELPKQTGRGRNRWGVVRFQLENTLAGNLGLKLNDTALLHLFQGQERLPLPEKGPAVVSLPKTTPQEWFTLAVNSAYRTSPISVEVVAVNEAPKSTRAKSVPKPAVAQKTPPAKPQGKRPQQAQQPPKPAAAKPLPKPAPRKKAPPKKPQKLSFKRQLLHKDNIEGCAVGDLDGDGDLDIVAGERFYLNPEWKPNLFRRILPFGADYMQDNGDHLWDVDGDGDLDVISGEFTTSKVHWFENPGTDKLNGSKPWEAREWVDTGTVQNEMTFFHDVSGDGIPDWIENSWNDKNPMLVWRMDSKGTLTKSVIGEAANGHGQGFGDVNGDGLDDIVFKQGWYERPAENPWSTQWKFHPDFVLPHASCPILVLDLNDDGRNDLIWGHGHSYGLYWDEQLRPAEDGTTNWRRHVIDARMSQAHALAWEDLDRDGKPDLITGKRYYAHSGKDPGAEDPIVLAYYTWNQQSGTFAKHSISSEEAGTGLQIRVEDLDGNGWKDLVVPGKSGTHILWNQGFSKP